MVQFMKFIILVIFVDVTEEWRAVPANQAQYALRDGDDVLSEEEYEPGLHDDLLPRDQLSHIYRFGYCHPDAIRQQYFRKSVNITLPRKADSQLHYIYLLAKKHTINYKFQCIIMKSFVPKKYLFYKSRLPLYYCQGVIYLLMLTTINRYEVHEFYLHDKLDMPVNFNFEFYHPTPI